MDAVTRRVSRIEDLLRPPVVPPLPPPPDELPPWFMPAVQAAERAYVEHIAACGHDSPGALSAAEAAFAAEAAKHG